MPKRRIAVLSLLLALCISPQAIAADFKKGLNAARNGDYLTALQEWKPLAEHGDAYAQFNLGVMYDKGEGVPQDYAEAAKWYHKAAEQNHATAQYSLGLTYGKGDGVPQDYAEAAKWYRKAAEQGHVDAKYILGLAYVLGQGVPQDVTHAHMWVNLAAAQGHTQAAEIRSLIVKEMTPAQIQEAQQLAREWVESH